LLETALPALIGTLFFAVLPVNAQVVSWISASDESLYVILVLMALCAVILASHIESLVSRTRWMILAGFLFAMALFTKETAVGAGLVLVTYSLIESRRKKISAVWIWPVYLLPVAVYFLVRALVMRGDTLPTPTRSFLSTMSILPSLALLALRQLTWPRPLSLFYEAPAAYGFWTIAGLVVLLFSLAATSVLLASRRSRLSLAATFLAGPLLPWAFLLPHLPEYVLFQDRYLYMPSIAISILVCDLLAGIERKAWRVRTATAACILLCAALAVRARRAAVQYHDDIELFSHAVQVAPGNVTAIGLLADAKTKAGDASGALALYSRAVRLRPDRWDTNFHLAMAYLKFGAKQSATAPLQLSLSSPSANRTQQALSWYELGKLQAAGGDLAHAVEAFHKAEDLEPASRRVHGELAAIYAKQGKWQESEQEKLKMLRALPAPAGEDSTSFN
jgi:protein O-mannosyl-transferase